jgi:hypothetical protein
VLPGARDRCEIPASAVSMKPIPSGSMNIHRVLRGGARNELAWALPHARAWLVPGCRRGESAARASCGGRLLVLDRSTFPAPMSHTLTTFRTRSPSRTRNDHDVQPRVCPAVRCAMSAIDCDTDRVAVRTDGRRAGPGNRPPDQRRALSGRVISGSPPGGQGVGARVAGPQPGA